MKAEKLANGKTIQHGQIWDTDPETIGKFMNARKLYFDLETTGLNPWQGAEVALVQMYDPITETGVLAQVQEGVEPPEWFCNLFRSPERTMIGHNICGFDNTFLALWGVPWKAGCKYFDTLIAESVITTSGRRDVSKSLRESVRRRTGDIVNKELDGGHGHWRAPLNEQQIAYAATDVLVLPELMDEQVKKADDTGQTGAIDLEMDIIPAFVSMNLNGLPIHRPSLDRYLDDLHVRMAEAEKLLRSKLGPINLNSTQQLQKAFLNLGIEIHSTAHNVLVDQILFDPESDTAKLFQALIDYKAPRQRNNMYGSAEWQAENIQSDGRIHSRFWQIGTETFRSTSTGPNLQQVPKDMRYVFGGVPGYKVVQSDHSQIEVRIAAEISGDTVLMETLENEDVHSAIGSRVFGVTPETITKAQRKLAKAMVFTLLFGGGWKVLYEYARRSGSLMTELEAMELFKAFFEAFPGLASMRAKAYNISRTRRVVVVTLPHGGRRVLVGRSMVPTIILNTPVQSSAAVGMKFGIREALRQGLDEYMSAVVHDEAVACVPDREAVEYGKELEQCLLTGMRKVVKVCQLRMETKVNDFWQM